MAKFSHLSHYDPKGRRVWYRLPTLPPIGELELVHAGTTNKAYTNAVAKATAKSGAVRRAAQGQVDASMLEESLNVDRDTFSRHVVVGWRGVSDENGADVPFSSDACREFLYALPDWLMRDLSNWAANPRNFLPDDVPTPDEIEEQAGN